MVTLRRKPKVPTEAPAADPQPAASPRKSRRAAPRSQVTTLFSTSLLYLTHFHYHHEH